MKSQEIRYTTPSGERGFLFAPAGVLEQSQKVPMVVMMMCTGGEAKENAVATGWADKASSAGIFVLAPNYNNYATYSEIDTIMAQVAYAVQNYPVDTTRVYATGFSNGGAMAVALASRRARPFAAIGAYGWMVDMRGQDKAYDMPFQVIQGTREFTERIHGHMAVMDDERRALRSLFLLNDMIDKNTLPDYRKTPYWGYAPQDTFSKTYGGRDWRFSNYYKDGYTAPFAQLILIDGGVHAPDRHEADVSWEFFKVFARDENGGILEEK